MASTPSLMAVGTFKKSLFLFVMAGPLPPPLLIAVAIKKKKKIRIFVLLKTNKFSENKNNLTRTVW